jgi:hypothetical protein
VVKYRKIPPAAHAANQIAENARIPPAADLQKNKNLYDYEKYINAPSIQNAIGMLFYTLCFAIK